MSFINYKFTAILYMYICSLIACKMLHEKGSTAETSWENKGKNLRFDLFYITARQLIGSDMLTIRIAHTENTHNTFGSH